MRNPLVLPAAAFAAGILLSHYSPFSVHEAAWPTALFFGLACIARAGWLRRICALLAMFCVGTLTEAWHRPGPPPQIDAGFKETVLLDGCVVEPTVLSPGREQFTLELAPGARARVSYALDEQASGEKIETPRLDIPRLDYGQRVEIEARVRAPHNYSNPGSFDYAAYLAHQNIFWTATMIRGSSPTILPGRCGSRFMGVVFGLRSAALERLDRLYAGDEYAIGMMQAILIGETAGLQRVWTDSFRRTGTFHALVISGIHVTVLAGVLLFLLRLCAMPELAALALTAAAAWLYALVSGLSAPVVRAAGGFSLFLAARFLFRKTRIMNLLAAITIVYLIWDPNQLFDASFQLSFLSVAAIGALAAPLLEPRIVPLARGMRSIGDTDIDPRLDTRVAQARVELRLAAETIALWTRLPRRWMETALALGARLALFAAEMVVISTVIQIGLALPMAEYFHRVSLTGLTANLLICPVMEAVVPMGFAAIFTNLHWVAWLTGALLKFCARAADWHARLEPSWRVPDPPLWLAVSFAAALVALALAVRRRLPRWAAAVAVLILFALLLWQPWPAPARPGVLELTSIDVGQGDSHLLIFPDGKRMLIDGGGILQYGRTRKTNLDMGEDVVSPYLWNRGIRNLDVVVETHAHVDHIGGLPAVLDNFHPRELWTGANAAPELNRRAQRLGIQVMDRRAGEQFDFSGAHIEILSPPPDYLVEKVGNNDSLAFRVSYGSRSILLTGDMERPMEGLLLTDGADLHSDVLKVGHHGSRTSTILPFLEAVAPSVAVISAGYENSFGHPHPDVVRRLAQRHITILRTDQDGLVSVSTDGRRLWFDEMAWSQASREWTAPFAW
ncbi:MAG TPA: DNA internalization-related competence protein ComEC/Rec2 [Bryobacteraceae bacterium]